MMNRSNYSGFTLVELMISLVILSLLLFTGSYSYSILAERWNSNLGSFEYTAKQSRQLNLLNSVLSSIQPLVITDKDGQPSFLFVGDQHSLLAMTNNGITQSSHPEIFRLTLVDEGGDGDTSKLLYQSVSSKNVVLKQVEQEIEFTHEIVILDDIKSFHLRYLGWRDIHEKSNANDSGALPNWYDKYSSIERKLTPNLIQMDSELLQGVVNISFKLPEDIENMLTPYFQEKQ